MEICKVAHILGVDEVRSSPTPIFETYVKHGDVRYRVVSFDVQSIVGKIISLRRAGFSWDKNSHAWKRN